MLKKKLVSIALTIILSFTSITVYGDMDISSKSALLMDSTSGDIIFAVNEKEELPPASITKIMTLLLTMEALDSNKINLSDEVNISENASKMAGTSIYLDVGEMQTVENLIKAISIRSANDACVAIAEHISGSEESFVALMNEKAEILGMENTHFSNSTGLPIENHYTTAYDTAIMSRELLMYPNILKYLGIYMEDLKVGKSKTSIQTMVNTNRLVKNYDGANGIKTGYTEEAKHCISASAKKGDLQLIAVILGASTSPLRFEEAANLLDHGFSNYESISIGKKGDIFSNIPIEKGKNDFLDLILEKDANVLLPKGSEKKIEKNIKHPKYLNAPIQQGEQIGELEIVVEGKIVDKINLLAKSDVNEGHLGNILKKVWIHFLFN